MKAEEGLLRSERRFYKIGEVCRLLDVPAHVLRYWELEFRQLKPLKTRGSHRMYRSQDIEFARQLKEWLHVEGLTIQGAKRRLAQQKTGQIDLALAPAPEVSRPEATPSPKELLVSLRASLDTLRAGLRSARSPRQSTWTVRVHSIDYRPARFPERES